MRWRECRLGDVIRLQRGHDLPSDKRLDGDVPVVSSSGITGFHNEAKAQPPGVVTGRYGTLGQVYFLDRDYWPLNTALYVTDFKNNDPKFVAYFLKHVLTDYQSAKAAVPGVDRNVLHELKVRVPDESEQKRIAETLSAYDDLIDNNRRRIQLLENSVRLLFDEWFVKLQVPKDAGLSNAVADQIQWTRCTLGDLCLEVKNSVLPTELDSDMPYIGLEHLPRRSITLCDWGQASEVSSLKSRFIAGDIIFGKIRPYFHKVGVALTDGVCSSDTIVIRAQQQEWYPFLVALLSSDPFIASTSQAMKEGTKMPRADWKQMKAYPVRLPELKVAARFSAVVQPVLAQLKTLALQSRQLHLARDLLLPRLMSGEIEV